MCATSFLGVLMDMYNSIIVIVMEKKIIIIFFLGGGGGEAGSFGREPHTSTS